MTDVFISYKQSERSTAEAFYKALTQEGLNVWWDAGLQAGDTYDQKIQKLLQSAKAIVVLWSPQAVESEWVRGEATIGRERGVLVPVMIKRVDVPVPFNLIHTANLTGWNGDRTSEVYRSVVSRLKEMSAKQNVQPLTIPRKQNLRAIWMSLLVTGVLAAAGASLWALKPWENAIASANTSNAASSADGLSVFGVSKNDFRLKSGRLIARHVFNPALRPALESDTSDNADIAALKCAVMYWASDSTSAITPNVEDACRRAADSGSPAAQLYYGQLLGDAATQAAEQRNRNDLSLSSLDYIRKSASQNFPLATLEYATRLGAMTNDAEARKKAVELLTSPAVKDLPAAQFRLAVLYISAPELNPSTAADAYSEIQRAADLQVPEAQLFMASAIIEGRSPQNDLAAAARYAKLAAAADAGEISSKAAALVASLEAASTSRGALTGSSVASPTTQNSRVGVTPSLPTAEEGDTVPADDETFVPSKPWIAPEHEKH